MAIFYRFCVPIVVLCLPMAAARADDGDDTLRYYLSKSSLVVSGKIVEGPRARILSGVIYVSLKLKVTKVIKGEADGDILVGLTRYRSKDEPLPEVMKKPGSVILFLNKGKLNPEIGGWVGADPWFAIQPYNSVLERSLARVHAE
ncbi:MAG TPA: hypothetical protein VMV10_20895 [Pirellulales bacterium]|nr:hypothetical protein [Pirellulales bacterium]